MSQTVTIRVPVACDCCHEPFLGLPMMLMHIKHDVYSAVCPECGFRMVHAARLGTTLAEAAGVDVLAIGGVIESDGP